MSRQEPCSDLLLKSKLEMLYILCSPLFEVHVVVFWINTLSAALFVTTVKCVVRHTEDEQCIAGLSFD